MIILTQAINKNVKTVVIVGSTSSCPNCLWNLPAETQHRPLVKRSEDSTTKIIPLKMNGTYKSIKPEVYLTSSQAVESP